MASTGSTRDRRKRGLLPSALRQARSNRHHHQLQQQQQHQLLLPQQSRASTSEQQRHDRLLTTRQRKDADVRRSNASRSSMQPVNQSQSQQLSDDAHLQVDEMLPLQRVGVAVLGARGVGKTSLVCQFVYHDLHPPDDRHTSRGPSQRRSRYHHVPVVVDNRLYDLRLTDCPAIGQFPASSLQEWTDYRGYGLRQAAAYVLVYNVADDDSFAYVRFMRQQILAYRGAHDLPIIIAANKADLQAGAGCTSVSRSRDTVANVVRKQWKCAYVECSARFNWRVVALFRELMKAVDQSVRLRTQRGALGGLAEPTTHLSTYLAAASTGSTSTNRPQEALQRNNCVIL